MTPITLGPNLALADEAAREAVADAINTGQRIDWFGLACALTDASAVDARAIEAARSDTKEAA